MSRFSTEEIACPLRAAAREAGDQPALVAPGRTFTYRELDGWVSFTAEQMRSRKMQGRRVALLLDSDWPIIVLILAAVRAGAIVCPISTRLPAAGVTHRVRAIDAFALVTDKDGFEQALKPDKLLASERAHGTLADVTIQAEQPATIIFTSGSTGEPRGALHSFGSHYFSAVGSNENIPLEPGDRWLLSLPLYHVGGLAILFRCLLGRAAVVVPHRGHDPSRELAKVSHVSMVATQLKRLMESRQDYHLRALLIGGSAIPQSLIVEAYRRGLPVHTTYGLTEMASQVATTPPGASPETLRTSGHVLRHREIRIDDRDEIHVRGETRFDGYVERNELIRPFDADGWFATGDLGRIDTQERLHVTGRKDNMFVSGGENIQPEEIEAALTSIAEVRRAVVVPISSEEFGQRPVAFLDRTSHAPSDIAIRAVLEKQLPKYMVPDAFYDWPEAGSSEGMKVDRKSLRRIARVMHDSR